MTDLHKFFGNLGIILGLVGVVLGVMNGHSAEALWALSSAGWAFAARVKM